MIVQPILDFGKQIEVLMRISEGFPCGEADAWRDMNQPMV